MRVHLAKIARAVGLLLVCSRADSAAAACTAMQWTTPSADLALAAGRGLLSADFDGDGKLDLLGLTATQVGFAPGVGTGAFTTPVTVAAEPGAALYAFVKGDFNGDGQTDVAIADDGLGRLLVYTRTADGRFAAPVVTTAPIFPLAIAAGDFDGDGKLDVAIADWELSSIIVMAGEGAGGFRELKRSPTSSAQPTRLATADIDGDGHLDLAMTHYASATVDVLFGRGDGTFDTAVTVDAGHVVEPSIALADFNGDGFADLATVSRQDDAVAVNSNLGGRFFAPPRSYAELPEGAVAADNSPTSIVAGDFNGDGRPDLVTTAPVANYLVFFGSAGDGTLGNAQFVKVPRTSSFMPSDLTAADFDRDNRIDLAIRNNTRVYLAINRCGDSQVTLTTAAPIISSDQATTLTASVAPIIAGAPLPTGRVSFSEGATTLGEASLVAGTATFVATGLTAGAHTISATFEGDENYTRNSADVTQNVTDGHSRLVLTRRSSGAIEYGTNVDWDVMLYDPSGAEVSAFKADLSRDGTSFASGNSYSGVFYGSAAERVVGPHTVRASFAGDSTNPPASATLSYETVKAHPYFDVGGTWGGTIFQLVIPQDLPSVARVSLRPNTYGAPPIGKVTTRIDGQPADSFTWPISPEPNLSMPAFSPGVHYAEGFYEGDDHYLPASNVLTVIVNATRAPVWLAAQFPGRFINMHFGPLVQGYKYSFTFRLLRSTQPQGGYIYTAMTTGPYGSVGWEYWHDGPCEVRMVVTDTANRVVGTAVDVGVTPRAGSLAWIWPGQPILAGNFTEALWQVNQLRWAAYYLAPLELPSLAAGLPVRAADLAAIRAALDEARVALGAPPVVYTRPVEAGDVIHAADIREVWEGAW